MSGFARISMVACLLGIAFAIGGIWVPVIYGDLTEVIDLLSLNEAPLITPTLAELVLGFALCLFLLISLGWAFWSIHKALYHAPRREFDGLARDLSHCAWSLIAFWSSIILIDPGYVWVLSRNMDGPDKPEIDPFIFVDTSFIMFVLGIALLAVSRAMAKAHEIATEHDQFL
jgi:hypothetical protein